jgi:hypothetical protein
MPTPNKYASDGRKYDEYNPRPESKAFYIHRTDDHWPHRPFNIGRNELKRAVKAQKLKLARALHAG